MRNTLIGCSLFVKSHIAIMLIMISPVIKNADSYLESKFLTMKPRGKENSNEVSRLLNIMKGCILHVPEARLTAHSSTPVLQQAG